VALAPLHLVVARILQPRPFEQLPAALGRFETGRACGKLVLKVR
jgi:hypothetical protein